jgi:hypothetical protein
MAQASADPSKCEIAARNEDQCVEGVSGERCPHKRRADGNYCPHHSDDPSPRGGGGHPKNALLFRYDPP